MEGAAARIYFSAFPHLIRNPQFTFNGRSKRPPLDPVNALMSFAYTMVTNEVSLKVEMKLFMMPGTTMASAWGSTILNWVCQ